MGVTGNTKAFLRKYGILINNAMKIEKGRLQLSYWTIIYSLTPRKMSQAGGII